MSPLAATAMIIEMLLEGNAPQQQLMNSLGLLNEQLNFIRNIVKNIYDVEMMRNGTYIAKRQQFGVHACFAFARALFTQTA